MRIVIGLVRDDLGSGAGPRERALSARGTVVTALDLPRLVFSGDFQAEVSTVNNDVRHYDAATFQPRFQHVQTGPSSDGWWNPSGSGVFRLLDCPVRTVVYRDGSSESRVDEPESALRVTGAAARVSGKIVDLDPQWQLASEIWGLGVRVEDADGGTVFEGEFEPAPFRDIAFGRQAPPVPNGQSASAVYTSRLVTVRSGPGRVDRGGGLDRNSTRLNSSHPSISYAVFCLKKKKNTTNSRTAKDIGRPAAPRKGSRNERVCTQDSLIESYITKEHFR